METIRREDLRRDARLHETSASQAAAAPRLIATDYPRRSRGGAAVRFDVRPGRSYQTDPRVVRGPERARHGHVAPAALAVRGLVHVLRRGASYIKRRDAIGGRDRSNQRLGQHEAGPRGVGRRALDDERPEERLFEHEGLGYLARCSSAEVFL